jgi:hypothetical protein
VQITIPSSININLGGCSKPFIISLLNAPFVDLIISYTFNNTLYPETSFYPNPHTTKSSLVFTSTEANNTFSFCAASNLSASSIDVTLHLSGTNYNSYYFSPSSTITFNVQPAVVIAAPTIALALNNQQKSFLDVNFTNNVDGLIYYALMLGKDKTAPSIQSLQVDVKNNLWIMECPNDFFTRIYANDRDYRIGQFFQTASQTTKRFSNMFPETFYTLCAYIENTNSVISAANCINLETLSWGSVTKATITFSKTLSTQ